MLAKPQPCLRMKQTGATQTMMKEAAVICCGQADLVPPSGSGWQVALRPRHLHPTQGSIIL